MKTAMNFLTVMVLSLVIFTSCTKKDSPAPPVVTPIISLVNLNGQWNNQKFEYNGVTYTECSTIPQNLSVSFTFLSISFQSDVPGTGGQNQCEEVDVCSGTDMKYVQYTLNTTTNILTLDNASYQIQSYDSATQLLVMQNLKTNGVNTLKKQ